jgi:hypothetical protein
VTRTVIVREDIQPQAVCTNFVERQVDHLSQDGAAHAFAGVRAQDTHKFYVPMRRPNASDDRKGSQRPIRSIGNEVPLVRVAHSILMPSYIPAEDVFSELRPRFEVYDRRDVILACWLDGNLHSQAVTPS